MPVALLDNYKIYNHWFLHLSTQTILLYIIVHIYLHNNNVFRNNINTLPYIISEEVLFTCYGILGATLCQTLNLTFRGIILISNGELQHCKAFIILLIISIMQMFCMYNDLITKSSTITLHFLGVEMPGSLWIEWISTVPFMFYLVSILDLSHDIINLKHVIIETAAWLSLLCLYSGCYEFPYNQQIILFVSGNILMALALVWQLFYTIADSSKAYKALQQINQRDRNDLIHLYSVDNYKLALCKRNCAIYMIISFSIFPALFYLRLNRVLSLDTYLISIRIISFISKPLFNQILYDMHVQSLDPIKLALIAEKQELESSRATFLRYIFHEVRVPLNSICLGIQVLSESFQSTNSNKQTNILDMMQDGVTFMTRTLNDVLSLQKVESGQFVLEKKNFAPESVLESILSTFGSQFKAKQILFTIQIFENVPTSIYADPFKLEHVLGNLVSNAIKFSADESEICVSISYNTKSNECITYAVRDQGPGINRKDQMDLFKPFVQIRPGELQQGRGSGLGLSICKTMITLHKGIVNCISYPRVIADDITTGTTEFSFTIPVNENIPALPQELLSSTDLNDNFIYPNIISMFSFENVSNKDKIDHKRIAEVFKKCKSIVTNSKALSSLSKLSHQSCPPSLDNLDKRASEESHHTQDTQNRMTLSNKVISNILIVDDVLSNRKMLNMLLMNRGYKSFDQCIDGKDALDLILSPEKGIDYYDLIFLDNMMPIMCGGELATLLRSKGFNKLIVGLTGNALDEDINSFITAGANIVLSKPLNMKLFDKVCNYCNTYGVIHHHPLLTASTIVSPITINHNISPSNSTYKDLISYMLQ